MRILPRFLLALALGLLLFVALDAASASLFSPALPHQKLEWYMSVLHGLLLAFQLVLPGLFAGWIARSRGWLVGALVGGLGLPVSALISLGAGPIVGPVASVLISGTTRAILVGLVAGIAGAAFRGQHPNNSFKPNALRSTNHMAG